MPKRYPPEFRRRVLELLKAGRNVSEVAAGLGVSAQSIYNWRRQEQIDSGLRPGVSSTDHAELIAARRRIAQLESELAVARRAAELLARGDARRLLRRGEPTALGATKLCALLGTRVSRLRMKCVLCRRRHNTHYADLRVMPTWGREALSGAGLALTRSA